MADKYMLKRARIALESIFLAHGYAPGHTAAQIYTKRWKQSMMSASINSMFKNGFVVQCGCDADMTNEERDYAWLTRGTMLVKAIQRAGHTVDTIAYSPGGRFDGRVFVVFLKES